MFVPCPHCGFLIARTSGAAAPRCPRCKRGTDEAPASGGADDDAASPPGATIPAADAGATTDAAPRPAIDPDAGTTATAAREVPVAVRHAGGPSFTRVRIDPLAALPRWPALLALLALSLLLALQLLLSQRAELASQAGWRPLLLATCTVFRCELPAWREPEAFTMLDRSVRPVADRPGLLRVNASFRNDARWPQAWPILVLQLSDADGRQVGQRAFQPAEYRPGAGTEEPLAPRQSTTVAFEVVEPAAHIVAYSFEFR